ncbi:hypothetical protein ZYGR_0AG04190 [Zygosaccharomyces rouxii]|uniref:Uncharacterized protein n=1 Tax=Zygosaccharomyces rouxii TaxID=4956 RepID=A0A1Q3A9W7_ZYGRO|nr:hypothetical protein ZYGR_0AG04190 [Zygosaccharomyces rouxii]
MLKRYFSSSLKYLSNKVHFEPVYANLLKHECFKALAEELPTKYGQLDPYELSQFVNEALAKQSLKIEEIIPIHNKMIEELSRYEYGISTVHAKKLEQIGGKLSEKSILEIIRNNPGRVHDTWELLERVPKELWVDDLLLAAVENTISKKTYEENGKLVLPLKSLAQCMLLLKNIDHKQNIKRDVMDSLIDHILERKASYAIQPLLQYGNVSLEPFIKRIEELTPYQIYQIYKNFPLDSLKAEEELFLKIVSTLGKSQKNIISQEEIQANNELEKCLQKFGEYSLFNDLSQSEDLSQDYLHIKQYINGSELDKRNLKLALTLMRIEGVYRDDLEGVLERYHSYLLSHENNANKLMFEVLLSFASQSFKKSNPAMLEYSQVFSSADYSESDTVNIIRIHMLANSKFDVEKSLELYNTNIESFAKGKDESSATSLLTESLIVAYLANQDLNFARVIFEGAIREKILSSHAIIKNLKALFKTYGEAVEAGNVKDVMQEKILRTFETI